MPLACGNDVIFRLILLQHQPHGLHIVTRKAPITAGLQVAQFYTTLLAARYLCDAISDLAGHKVEASPRGLMVIEDTRTGKEAVCFPIVFHHMMGKQLRAAIWASRMHGRILILGRVYSIAVQLTGRSLIESHPCRATSGDPYGLQ